jgi:hypothetical protein
VNTQQAECDHFDHGYMLANAAGDEYFMIE